MQKLWDILNGFQIISHLPLISIEIPYNLVQFFSAIIEVSSFDIIDSDYFFANVL